MEIHPSDVDFRPGVYYIGVYGSCESVSRYSLLCYLQSVREIHLLNSDTPIPIHLEEECYFKVIVNHAGASRVLVQTSVGSPSVALFLCPRKPYPNAKNHYYSMGYYDGRSPVYRPNEDTDSQTLYELDPFDREYYRDYVIKSKEEVRLDRTTSNLRLCIDTDQWISSSPVCHISLCNLTKSPIDMTISGYEIRELDLLTPLERSQSELIQSLYAAYDLVDISYSERLRKDIAGCHEYTYGEVDYVHFRAILPYCDLKEGEEFWDLGSGAGKCVLTMALSCPGLKRVVGVELLDDLYSLSTAVTSQVTQFPRAPIQIIHGNIFEVDWSGANCLYCSNLCFPEELLMRQIEQFQRLQAGTRIISLVRLPEKDYYTLLHSFKVKMTWGKADIFIYLVKS